MFKQLSFSFHVVSKTFITQNHLVFILSNIFRFSFQPRDNRDKCNFEKKNIADIILMTYANVLIPGRSY